MELFPPFEETIAGALASIRSGRRSCREVLESCLDRIDAREADVRAWAFLDRDGARSQADRLDADLRAGRPIGPLGGIPIGVKDIIDVKGLPSAHGRPGWEGTISQDDAAMVRMLRNRGAVILGKTVSTPYAWIDPPPTRNPWDLGRTPGGSSSGSAAAVAEGMCLGALGSQTGGSITRPASFCGVCGFKPAFGRMPGDGILPLSPSLDHPGPIARTVGDLALMADVPLAPKAGPTRIGRLRGFFEERSEPAMLDAMEHATAALIQAGIRVVEAPLPDHFPEFARHHFAIMSAEAATFHRRDFESDPARFPTRMTALIEAGLRVSAVEYLEAKRFQDAFRHEFDAIFNEVDALLTPAALGPAPTPETTGDPAFNSPWSLAGLPTITHPIGLDPEGLPLGLQLVGAAPPDLGASLFGLALRTERAIRLAAGAPELPPPGQT
ncbi:amidase [Tautonia sociabilis]|uniref:Amidase n=1 Tax=Tautonia sociabilis TaxID=2080755 RepID=A0A432MEX3_9BACT|nr:amidase [Tautonia sociabilis]RUL84223.1 amidase [Tautonia sociabilis]